MSTVAVESFSLESFNTLRFPKVTLKDLKPKWMVAVTKLHSVFLKYHMDDYFVLALAHRHHDLYEKELLVEVIVNGVSTTAAMVPDPEDQIVPHIWRILDGKLCPFEFINISKSDSIDKNLFCINYLRLLNSNDFIAEVNAILLATGTENILGIQTAHRHEFKRPGEVLSEESNAYRQSIVTSVPTAPLCNVPVSWKMGPDAEFCENCIPDWETCGEDADLEVPRKIACTSSGCGCGHTCSWDGNWHNKSGC
eukprot:gene7623-8231_t